MTATSTLSIRYGEHPVREPAGWFVAGSDPHGWLEVIRSWQVPLEGLLFYVLPGGEGNPRPLGALVVPEKPLRSTPGRAVPFGRVAERLYLPVGAQLFPPVSDAELAKLLPSDLEVCVWHPATGLVGFEPGEGVRFSRFLQFEPAASTDWSAAEPGATFNERLRSVRPTEVPGAIAVIEQGRDDIGTQADEHFGHPPAPGEAGSDSLSRLGSAVSAFLARIGIGLLNLIPKTASAPTWADSLQSWLMGKLQQAVSHLNLDLARERELRRLLAMLESDPDHGLKFAIPLGDAAQHRGLAPPGMQLTPHDINFSLGRLGGGGLADFWNVSEQTRIALTHKYRQLATRELQLGRHRRAAYIFAELVGDLSAAANSLMAGRHFREAAALYRERLKQPLEAARCLEKGGLWAEALELYEGLAQFEQAGDLARKLDQQDDAERLYRAAVAAVLKERKFVEAARLLDTKLLSSDEALEQLLDGWNETRSCKACIGETFRLVGRLSRHEQAGELLETLATSRQIVITPQGRAEEIVVLAESYPDASIRHAAADAARVLMARTLADEMQQGSTGAMSWIQQGLKRLAPDDRLVLRDSQRFVARIPAQEKPANPTRRGVPRGQSAVRASLVREMLMPVMGRCVSAAGTAEALYYAEYFEKSLFVQRQLWLENTLRSEHVQWPLAAGFVGAPLILAPVPRGTGLDYVQLVVDHPPPLVDTAFTAQGGSRQGANAGSPVWCHGGILAIARGDGGDFILQRVGDFLVLSSCGVRQELLGSQRVELSPEQEVAALRPTVLPVPMQLHGTNLYIGLDRWLIIVRANGKTESLEMPETIRSVVCSLPHTRTRIAVTFESGGMIVWDDFTGQHYEPFGQSLSNPVVGFTHRGFLVAASAGGARIYTTSDRHVVFATEIKWSSSLDPVAVLPTGGADEIALFFTDGRLQTYRVQG